jgi:methylmalonyl-CoA carboxyltransferase large subunit
MATKKKPESTDLAKALAELTAQVATLGERLAKLEGGAPRQVQGERPAVPPPAAAAAAATEAQPAPALAAPPAPKAPEISEEEVLVVSAALAAYFGVRMRIRQIRLLSSQAWAQQGRVSIQASHRLHN